MKTNVTGNEVKAAMIAADITKVDHHDCDGCGYMTAYVRQGEQLFFDPGCHCRAAWFEPRTWDDAADWINMQSDPAWRSKIAAKFGISQ